MSRWDRPSSNNVPDWFFKAVETEAREKRVEVDDCDVAYRVWDGDEGPGLLFIHGMNAHSHWWDFIAPAFIRQYRVAAMDLTGMGDSDFRYEYDPATYANEIVGVLDAAGFGRVHVARGGHERERLLGRRSRARLRGAVTWRDTSAAPP